MKRLSNFSIYLFLTASFLLLELTMPSYSYALGGAYIRSFERAIPTSLVLMVVFIFYLNLIKRQRPGFLVQLFSSALIFPVFLLISWYVYFKIEMRYTEPKIFFIEVAEFGTVEHLQQLLDQGNNPDVIDLRGDSALGIVAWQGDTEKAKMLLNRGADVNIKNKDGETPLMSAAKRGQQEMIQLLLEKGALINNKDDEGRTALMHAVIQEHPETVKSLLEAGADVNAKNQGGETALMEAALRRRMESLPLLLQKGANINAQDTKGRTALYDAVMCCSPEAAKILIEAGADINIKDKNGWSPKSLAEHSGRKELTNIFITADRNELKKSEANK